jgi:flagellar protein FlbD
MIVVTRLNDSQFAINPDLIERIHESPDTTLVMLDGAKYIVTESMTVVITRITEYRARVITMASMLQEQADGAQPARRTVARPLERVETRDQPTEPVRGE